MNFNPSSEVEEEEEDEDLCSDSGVSVKSDRSNGRLINFSLKRRRRRRCYSTKRKRHCNYRVLSSSPSGALTAGPRLQVKPDLGLSTVDRSLLEALLGVQQKWIFFLSFMISHPVAPITSIKNNSIEIDPLLSDGLFTDGGLIEDQDYTETGSEPVKSSS